MAKRFDYSKAGKSVSPVVVSKPQPVVQTHKEIRMHQHDLANFLMCPRKYKLSREYRPLAMRKAINIGGLFANCVYWLHQGKDVEECMLYVNNYQEEFLSKATSQYQLEELETSIVIVQSMLLGYNRKFIKEYHAGVPIIASISPEHMLEVPIIIGGFKFVYVNRLDGLVYDSFGNPWILELKTTAQFDKDLFDKLPTNFQINSYWFALAMLQAKPIAGVLYRYILKPSIRQKKTETKYQFRTRLMLDYETYQDEYFKETSIYFEQPNIVEFKKDMNIYFNELARAYVLDRWEKRGTACESKYGLCEYIKYCGDPTEETLQTFYEKVA